MINSSTPVNVISYTDKVVRGKMQNFINCIATRKTAVELNCFNCFLWLEKAILLAQEWLGLALHSKTKWIKKFKYIKKNSKTRLWAIDVLHSPPHIFYDSSLFYRFWRLVVNHKIKSEKSKAPTSPRISPPPLCIMKYYTANTVDYTSLEWLSAKPVQIVGYTIHWWRGLVLSSVAIVCYERHLQQPLYLVSKRTVKCFFHTKSLDQWFSIFSEPWPIAVAD